MSKKSTLYLIDGSAIAYRSHYGMRGSKLSNSKGMPTGACYAFVNTMHNLLEENKPDYIIMFFDAKQKTFRHEMYPEYKSNRDATPEDLVEQLPYLHQLSKALNISVVITPGYEADDAIGTFAKIGTNNNLEVFIVSSDKDLLQLVDENVKMYKLSTSKSKGKIVGEKDVITEYGITPKQIPDYLGMVGDSSDNIPGIYGIGKMKAIPLLNEYKNIEGIYTNLEKITNKRVHNLLIENKENGLLSKQLATINTNIPIDLKIDDAKFTNINNDRLRELFEDLEFHSLIKTYNLVTEQEIKVKKYYYTVDTANDIKKLIKKISKYNLLSVDLETTSVHPMEAEIVGISLSWEYNSGVYIPIQSPSQQMQLFGGDDNFKLLKEIAPILEDETISKCGQNLKYDYIILRKYGIELKNIGFDTIIAAFLIQPDSRSYKLDYLSQQYLHYKMQPIEDLIGKGKNQITMDQVEIDKITFYAAEDADIALQLVDILKKKLINDNMLNVYQEIDLPLLQTLAKIEENGVFVNVEYLKKMSQELSEKIKKLTQEIYFECEVEFNINSPKQLSEILFDHLKLPTGKKRSTAVNILEKLKNDHPVPGMVLDYRKLTKLQNTYLDALPKLVNKQTGRIHSSFNQTIASTGRLSSSHPNFQNIPIRTEIGRKIRHAFIPQRQGWKIIAADYSQIELRIMAHLSKDVELIRSFKENVDVHKRTASLVYSVDEKDVTSDMRRTAKVVNFGIMYGAGPFRLSNELGISMTEARELIDQYFLTYPGINHYIVETLEQARENGYVATLFGRRRYTQDIESSNKNIRETAERSAINMPIQGTAADMIKIAMNNIHKILINENWETKMIMQVHDELIFECPDEEVEKLKNMVIFEMENALKLDIPIKVDIGFGNSWYEAH